MIWTTQTAYADRQTGEELPKKKITNGEYIVIETKIKTEIKNNTYGIRKITYGCDRNNQTKLDF